MKVFKIMWVIAATIVAFWWGLWSVLLIYAQGPVVGDTFVSPLAIDTFTLSPSSVYPGQQSTIAVQYTLGSGNDSVAICVYVPTALSGAYTLVNPTSGYTEVPNGCPDVTNYEDTNFYRNDFAPFGGTFTFSVDLVVHANATASTYTIGVVQYEGTAGCDNPSGATCNTSSSSGKDLSVLPNPTRVYVDSGGSCGGNTPCYTALTNPITGALESVAAGGTVVVMDDFSGTSPTISKDVTIEGTSGSKIGPVAIQDPANVTLRGTTINGGGATAITNNSTNAATVYANNFENFTTALAGTGTTNAPYNWWGQYTTQPSGVSAADWAKRLGAPVSSWGMGTLGAAKLEPQPGSTGTGIIVSHGNSAVPFDQGVFPYSSQVCSDYYDFFVLNGSGDWKVTVPVDAIEACDVPLTNVKLFVFATLDNTPDFATCAAGPSPNADPACWDSVGDAGGESITSDFSTRTLIWTTASVGELNGTPIVAGTTGGADPTAVTLESFSGIVFTPSNRLVAVAAGLLGVAVMARTAITLRAGRRR